MLDINASGGGQTDERATVSRAAHLIAAMTALSRLAGLARDAAVSAVFGAGMGADVVTIPFDVFEKLIKHPLTDIGQQRFLKDWGRVAG